jgi:hypothetical protein
MCARVSCEHAQGFLQEGDRASLLCANNLIRHACFKDFVVACQATAFQEVRMLWTIFVILLVLWLLGVVSSYTLGGFIHILLVIALVVLVLQLLSGRRQIL